MVNRYTVEMRNACRRDTQPTWFWRPSIGARVDRNLQRLLHGLLFSVAALLLEPVTSACSCATKQDGSASPGPTGTNPEPTQALKIGSFSGLFETNSGVPVVVSGLEGGGYFSGFTDGGGLTPEFQVLQRDPLSVTYGEAVQVHGLAVGVVRHFVPTVNKYGELHTDVRSQPTAWPVVLGSHREKPTLSISPELADWAIMVPPKGPKIRGHFAPLLNAADIEAALEYQGYGNSHSYEIGLAIRQGQLHYLGAAGLEVELLTDRALFPKGASVDVVTLRTPGELVAGQPACASGVVTKPGVIHFKLLGNLEPGWTFLLARAAGTGDPICHSGLAAPPLSPAPTVTPEVQDSTDCLACSPYRPLGTPSFCNPQGPDSACPSAWTNEPIADFAQCSQFISQLSATKCGPRTGGSIGWKDSLEVSFTVSTKTTTTSVGSDPVTTEYQKGTIYSSKNTGVITANVTAGQFDCGQCGGLWLVLNVCGRDWDGQRSGGFSSLSGDCAIDVKGRVQCITGEVVTTTLCSQKAN